MSTDPARLLGWFLGPPEAEARVTAPLVLVPEAARRDVVAHGDLHPAVAAAGPGRVCVLGGDASAVAFGLALAQRLARASGGRTVVACVWSEGRAGAPGRRGGPPTTAASRRLAAALAAGGHDAVPRGRVVQVRLPAEPAAAAAAFASVEGRAGPVGAVAILVGARTASLDAVLARQDVVVAVVVADAPSALLELAERSLATAAPAAVVRAVALPARLAGPARRAAVTRALESLR